MPYRRKRRRNPRRTMLKLNPRRRRTRRRYRRNASVPRMRHALIMNPRRRRRRSRKMYRRRRNPSYWAPTLRMNPVRRRRRRRSNPNGTVKRLMSQRWLMSVASIGIGIAAGYYTLPLANALVPAGMKAQFRPFSGLLNVASGSLMIALARGRGRGARFMKETGAIVAGTGVYDLIAENFPQMGLTPIPKTNPVVSQLLPGPVSASYTVGARPVSRQASSIGASYAYGPVAYGASYEAPGATTEGLGSDDPFTGMWQ